MRQGRVHRARRRPLLAGARSRPSPARHRPGHAPRPSGSSCRRPARSVRPAGGPPTRPGTVEPS
ncbi:hypothetical protein HMPREF0682_1150 [Propionibacterium acidifaciens F0233]|uniref:Uncharacterized protein n=1 Tax=Propionibacterium acidifaciens F0233 TaxID=553198 RepID=U2R2A6_9ACTN|nr:hypothetical protein HMPREF0682_1150 [Propionibacterium acidifaciens F0233]